MIFCSGQPVPARNKKFNRSNSLLIVVLKTMEYFPCNCTHKIQTNLYFNSTLESSLKNLRARRCEKIPMICFLFFLFGIHLVGGNQWQIVQKSFEVDLERNSPKNLPCVHYDFVLNSRAR